MGLVLCGCGRPGYVQSAHVFAYALALDRFCIVRRICQQRN